jgi:hypothetical protein
MSGLLGIDCTSACYISGAGIILHFMGSWARMSEQKQSGV